MMLKLASNDYNPEGKECLLVIHGLFGASDNWRNLAAQWASAYRVITVDLRNHAYSPHHDSMTYPLMANDVLGLMDAKQIATAHVLGHSMGGKVAAQMALLAPERVASLIMADIAPVTYQPRHEVVFAGLNAVVLEQISSRKQALGTLQTYIDDPKVCQFLAKSLYKTPESGFAWRFNLPVLQREYVHISAAPAYKGVIYDGPVLVIKGQQSVYVQAQHKPAFAALFSNVQVKIIQGAGHWLHVENPRIFSHIVLRFLQQHPLTVS